MRSSWICIQGEGLEGRPRVKISDPRLREYSSHDFKCVEVYFQFYKTTYLTISLHNYTHIEKQ